MIGSNKSTKVIKIKKANHLAFFYASLFALLASRFSFNNSIMLPPNQ